MVFLIFNTKLRLVQVFRGKTAGQMLVVTQGSGSNQLNQLMEAWSALPELMIYPIKVWRVDLTGMDHFLFSLWQSNFEDIC